jgi:transcriptional regulator with GAF, ATPase, and Fis domain
MSNQQVVQGNPAASLRRSSVMSCEEIVDAKRNQAGRAFDRIIGNSAALESVLEQVERVAPTDSTVLIQGETGTGKELIAQAIHNVSARCGRALIKFNCAAIPLDLMESELFGHERGAFTGALTQKIGRFEMAHQGTLFLDEVGDIPPALQPKLLRVLQEQEFERLGSCRTHHVDVRLVAATNRDLAAMVAQGEFRSDLYYRLNVFPILLPPLRSRREDIPALVERFVNVFSRRIRKQIDYVSPETMAGFQSYPWPGNVRELENMIERAVILANDGVLPNPLPTTNGAVLATPANVSPRVPKTLRDSERALILETLDATGWVIGGSKGAATQLGLKRTTLIHKMKKLGIERQLSDPAAPLMITIADKEREVIEAALGESGGQVAGPKGAAAKLGIPRQTLDSKIASLGIDKWRFQNVTRYAQLLRASSFVPATTDEAR